ncbi:hypothetical protein KC887_02055 [Candidatus Kaiserbacteria bacterium]|nr:hypothetical protein [Candidatus Kaiserbacteria bacterium]
MGKKLSDAVLDAACNHIKNNATSIILLDAEPATRAAAVSAALATIAVVSGDFTLADGDTSGRKVTVAAKSGTASASGNHNHTAVISGTDLLAVTTSTTTKAINSGDTVNSSAFKLEIPDTPV